MSLSKLNELYIKTDFDTIVSTFSKDEYIRFFLLKSICKGEVFKKFNSFLKDKGIKNVSNVSQGLSSYYSNNLILLSDIKKFVESTYLEESSIIDIHSIIAELSNLPHFDWGGIYQNALESKIVKNIQKTYIYSEVKSMLEGELFNSYLNYGLSSWYNYWSSVMVEHYFKIHNKVIPTVGLIKHVDFIFDGIPVDLKVTYLPQEYVDKKREEQGLDREFKILKDKFKNNKSFDFSKENLSVLSHAISTSKNLNDKTFNDIKDFRDSLVNSIISNEDSRIELMSWLYENQGTRRYDNSFRLFLICIDDIEVVNGWQMKINLKLQDKVNEFLDKGQQLKEIVYNWEGKELHTKADCIIVKKSML